MFVWKSSQWNFTYPGGEESRWSLQRDVGPMTSHGCASAWCPWGHWTAFHTLDIVSGCSFLLWKIFPLLELYEFLGWTWFLLLLFFCLDIQVSIHPGLYLLRIFDLWPSCGPSAQRLARNARPVAPFLFLVSELHASSFTAFLTETTPGVVALSQIFARYVLKDCYWEEALLYRLKGDLCEITELKDKVYFSDILEVTFITPARNNLISCIREWVLWVAAGTASPPAQAASNSSRVGPAALSPPCRQYY